MSYELIITEKPSAAQKIAYALSKEVERKRYGPVVYYKLKIDKKEVVVVSAVGHLFTLKERTRSFPSFDLEWAPAHEVSITARYTRIYLETIKALAKDAGKWIIGTDYDLEGDLIGANIIRHFGSFEKTKRMHFSTLTEEELREAYENLEEVNMFNILASETRHLIDWMYGINLSRAVMLALKNAGRTKILSIGRVQGPMLKYLVERDSEIKSFIPQPYWELFAYSKGIKFQHTEKKFPTAEEAERAQLATPNEGTIEIKKERKKIYPPPPFDFTTLQTEAYRNFGFSPTKTQKLAQSLYEGSMISYPRTSSQKLPYKLNLPSIIQKLSKIEKYNYRADYLIEKKRYKPREGKKEDPAHPSVFPTGVYKKISGDEEKIYDLITSRFLSCFAEPAELEEWLVYLVANDQKYELKTRHIIVDGWLNFYQWHGIEENNIPPFKHEEKVQIEKFEINKRQTSPPPRFTPATILELLESLEIGTKATRAQILDTLYKRGYVIGRQIAPTPLGVSVYEVFEKYVPHVVDPELTRKLEKEMEEIQEGKLTQQKVISNAKEILTEVINGMAKREKEIGKELLKNLKETEAFAPCVCGGTLRILQKNKKKFLGCTNYPKCTITFSLPFGFFTYAEQCKVCKSPVIWMFKDKGRFKLCLNRDCPTKIKKKKE